MLSSIAVVIATSLLAAPMQSAAQAPEVMADTQILSVLVLPPTPSEPRTSEEALAVADIVAGGVSQLPWAMVRPGDGALACPDADCAAESAIRYEADIVVYGTLLATEEHAFALELKAYSAVESRLLGRVNIDAPNLRVLEVALPDQMAGLITEPPPPPPVVEVAPPSIFESPVLVGGAAIAAVGLVVTAAAAGHLLDGEIKLATPQVSRALKAEALATAPYAFAAIGVGSVLLVAGVGLAALAFVLPQE